MKHFHSFAVVALCFSTIAVASAQPSLKQSATKVFAERKANTVSLTVTRKKANKDSTFVVPALCMKQEGLLVTSLSQLEHAVSSMDIMVMAGGKVDTDAGELTRVAMMMTDGSEVEAELVLRDPDLDLAFVRLKPQDEKVELPETPAAASEKAVLLDDILAIDRLGPNMQRIASCALVEIASVIETPRELYIPTQDLRPGSALYNLNGELLGLAAKVKGTVVIVPTGTIQKLADSIKPVADQNN